jgi:hypothetical protein
MCARAVDMLAVAVQMPAAVLADDGIRPATIAASAQKTEAPVFVLTIPPFDGSMTGADRT